MVLVAFPREEASALICGDVVLSLACHRAVARGAQDAVRLTHDLVRRAQRLREVAPKLRAKGVGKAVALFLCEDAVLPRSDHKINSGFEVVLQNRTVC